MQMYFIKVSGYVIPTPYLTYEAANAVPEEMNARVMKLSLNTFSK